MSKLYTRKDNRLAWYNYSDSGVYYVTVCSLNRKCIFGDINCVGGRLALPRIKLSKISEIINPMGEYVGTGLRPVRYNLVIK
jgi:hypothetical protein